MLPAPLAPPAQERHESPRTRSPCWLQLALPRAERIRLPPEDSGLWECPGGALDLVKCSMLKSLEPPAAAATTAGEGGEARLLRGRSPGGPVHKAHLGRV